MTTVTVPDGGTVLLGGVKRLDEERKEYGVPVLSKTPWIDRLFRNVGIGRISTSLMLMVTPRIIILEEEEERLGIPTTPSDLDRERVSLTLEAGWTKRPAAGIDSRRPFLMEPVREPLTVRAVGPCSMGTDRQARACPRDRHPESRPGPATKGAPHDDAAGFGVPRPGHRCRSQDPPPAAAPRPPPAIEPDWKPLGPQPLVRPQGEASC